MHEAISKAAFEQEVSVLTDEWAGKTRLVVNSRSFPVLDITFTHATPLRLRIKCDNWSESPPSVDLLDADGNYLDGKVLPTGGIFNPGPHPSTGHPFICMRGTREFHTHPSHLNEKWDQYRGTDGMSILGIALQIGSAWKKSKV